MKSNGKKFLALILTLALSCAAIPPVHASNVTYMPDVTSEMSDPDYWAALQENPDEVILTPEEIARCNQDIIDAKGTMVMDLKTASTHFNGYERNAAVRVSATADAEYYFGWTYGGNGEKADWNYYQKMIDNCTDRQAVSSMPTRYGIAVRHTLLRVFPSDNPIWDDPNDPDFDYQALSGIRVNEPIIIYTTSADGKFYLARISSCSGWVAAEDVAICANREEWLSAWDLPSENLLVVYGNKVYTDASNSSPDLSRRMLAIGTALELAAVPAADSLITNRSPFHNYVVYLPVRDEDGRYGKQLALIPETAAVHVGYLPLTQRNIAMVAMQTLGDAYGWGGMMEVDDCSGLIRSIYTCFGLNIARNGNWQWEMNVKKIDMTHMSVEEKQLILDELPIGAALCFSGHEMLYLGKANGKYYVHSTVSSVISPASGNRLRTRTVMINTMDVRRANGLTWMQAINKAFVPCYGTVLEKDFDFPSVQWYHEGVRHCLAKGILSNKADGTFGTDDSVTRETLAQALWTIAGKPAAENTYTFADVPEGHKRISAICWAAESGILPVTAEQQFNPDQVLTRADVVAALHRFAAVQQLPVDSAADLTAYGDSADMDAETAAAFAWSCAGGIVQGNNNLLQPNVAITRAQLAVMLQRYAQYSSVQLML